MSRMAISVVGGSDAGEDVRALAYAVGAAIVRQGCHLVCGGRGGVMEAACQGAWECPQKGAAVTIGILPGADHRAGNPFLDVVIPSGMGLTRNALVVLTGQGTIAIGGGAGTLSEVALAWQFNRPVVALTPSGGWAARLAGQALDHKVPGLVGDASEPQEAVGMVIAAIHGRASASS